MAAIVIVDDGPATAAPTSLKGIRVLVVEDEPTCRTMLVRLLHDYGCLTMEAVNGRCAIDVLRDATVDIILLDCGLPDIDGYETGRRIRELELSRQPPIIATTGSHPDEVLEQCLEAGMNACVGKPYSAKELRTTMLDWLQRSPARPVGPPAS